MDLTRRGLLASAAALPLVGAAPPAVQPKRLVVVVLSGGWDSAYCLDPKPGVPGIDPPSLDSDPTDPTDIEQVETFSGIPVAFNDGRRPAVSQFFTQWASRCCVVNGVWMGGVSHMTNVRKLLSGTTVEGHSDIGTIASTELGADLPIGHVDLVGIALPGTLPSRLVRPGFTAQLRTLLGTDAAYEPTSFPLSDTQRDALTELRMARLERLRAVRGGAAPGDHTLDLIADATERRPGLEALAEPLDEAYASGGPRTYTYQLALTTELFRRDLCRVVTVSTGASWDTHSENTKQSDNLQQLFAGLNDLLANLQADGMVDTTTIAVVSEMTRSPLMNADNGKDHWPTATALLVGGDVAGGTLVGGTDDNVEPIEVDGAVPEYSNLAAGILQVLGVDSEPWLPGVAPLELG
jgi:hypothetical protein